MTVDVIATFNKDGFTYAFKVSFTDFKGVFNRDFKIILIVYQRNNLPYLVVSLRGAELEKTAIKSLRVTY